MVELMYSVTALMCALISLMLIIRPGSIQITDEAQNKAFKLLVIWTACFCVHDALWGVLASDAVRSDFGLFVSSTVFFVGAALTGYIWMNYVLTFLGGQIKRPIVFRIITLAIVAFQLVLLEVNIQTGCIFKVGMDGAYVPGPYRRFLFVAQFAVYVIIAVISAIYFFNSTGAKKKRFLAVFVFEFAPIITGILQRIYPDAPFYSIGYALACLVIFIFIVTVMNEERVNAIAHAEIEEESKRNLAVIADLSGDFIYVSYVELTANRMGDITLMYRESDYLADRIRGWKETKTFHDILELLTDYFVYLPDKERFHEATRRRVIIENLLDEDTYYVVFRTKIDGDVEHYQLKFTANRNGDEIEGFVVGLHNISNQISGELKEQEKLEHMVQVRTVELQDKNNELSKMNEEIIELLGNVTEARDAESGEHIRRVKGFTNIMARQMMQDYPELGITSEMIELMTSASSLHDIGKIMIPDAILLKPGKLTKEEFEIMKTHSAKGCELLKMAPSGWSDQYVKMCMDICRYHHEKYDGKGYPDGLVGEEIPLAAQIVSVVDCFDALTAKRVYKDAFAIDKAYDMILNGECGAFSPKLMDTFRKVKPEFVRHVKDPDSVFMSATPSGIKTLSLSWLKLLLVDDDDLGREIGKEILEAEGAQVTVAESGREAIEIFKNSEPEYFDAILMDVIMPGMTGIEAAREIRNLERSDAKSVSIIALTSLTTEDDVNDCLDAGMDSFLTKPIVISSFTKVLNECLKAHTDALAESVSKSKNRASEDLERVMTKNVAFSTLASQFDVVIYVNSITNDVHIFKFNTIFDSVFEGINPRLPENRRLDQFFKTVIPEDEFSKFLEDTDRNYLMRVLEEMGSTSVSFNAKVKGKVTPYRLKITKDNDRAGNFVFGMQNIEKEVEEQQRIRMELDTAKSKLSMAEEKAMTDPLTGVKNITAYTDAVAEWTEKIRNNKKTEFGVIMCDIDNLKMVNDTNGHDVGDVYIKNCCKIICDIFKHSPVFRMGGDEFAVLLSGSDFNLRNELFDQLLEAVENASAIPTFEAGKASFSAGLAIFNPQMDKSMSDVMKRADVEMYMNKRMH